MYWYTTKFQLGGIDSAFVERNAVERKYAQQRALSQNRTTTTVLVTLQINKKTACIGHIELLLRQIDLLCDFSLFISFFFFLSFNPFSTIISIDVGGSMCAAQYLCLTHSAQHFDYILLCLTKLHKITHTYTLLNSYSKKFSPDKAFVHQKSFSFLFLFLSTHKWRRSKKK